MCACAWCVQGCNSQHRHTRAGPRSALRRQHSSSTVVGFREWTQSASLAWWAPLPAEPSHQLHCCLVVCIISVCVGRSHKRHKYYVSFLDASRYGYASCKRHFKDTKELLSLDVEMVGIPDFLQGQESVLIFVWLPFVERKKNHISNFLVSVPAWRI